MTYTLQHETPVGPVTITATGEAVTQIRFGTTVPEGSAAVPETAATPLLLKAAAQLREYFAGTRRDFSLPLAPAGTPFQQSVWQALQTIPYGETRTYGHIAMQIGHNKSFRAVGPTTATPSSSSFPATASWVTTASSRATPEGSTSRNGCSPWKSGDNAPRRQARKPQSHPHEKMRGTVSRAPHLHIPPGQSPNAKALMPS